MEDRCNDCVYNGSGAIVCSVMALRNALEELYRSTPVIKALYKPRNCRYFELKEEKQ